MPPIYHSNESFSDFLFLAQIYWPRLLAAILAGGLIGAENQIYGKPAGLRTSLLVTISCCVITIVSIETGFRLGGEPSRITAQILTGVGFLGGGVILVKRGRVSGITTAATIFANAGIGIMAGTGFVFSAVAVAIVAFVVLLFLRPLDHFIDTFQPFARLRAYDRQKERRRKSLVAAGSTAGAASRSEEQP